MEIKVPHIDDLPQAAAQVLALAQGRKVWLFTGPVGAGKTTFIQAIGRQLGIEDDINSPTYALVNEYRLSQSDEPVYHLDLYRMESLEEGLQFGLEEYLFSGSYCFIEWPELLDPLLEELEVLRIELEIQPDSSRKILILGL